MALLGFGGGRSRHERAADQYKPVAQKVVDLEADFKRLSDAELKQKVVRHLGDSLSDLKQQVPEIYAGVREASARTLKMRHFEVQIIGGLALLDNAICEMKTGEGKTLSATLPLTLHALTGQGCHLVTVNDYLAERDAAWMRPVFEFFDLTVGAVGPGMSAEEKREAYAAEITYGTNNEFGFDYLRDNMATDPSQIVLRGLKYAIVDEVDNLLIDAARTPLIISAPDVEATQKYQIFARFVPRLHTGQDYEIKEKERSVELTDDGYQVIGEAADAREADIESAIERVLADAGEPMTVEQIIEARPVTPKVGKTKLRYMLADGVGGRWGSSGKGVKHDPLLYFALPGGEADSFQSPLPLGGDRD
ncbi:DEAD/DEAH box helicase [Patescibacteria group bacterium]|nr:DEAD/DEAH box helicase [Patescibacteria group bacterium]